MSDLMLHGVLNMPLPDDPEDMDAVTWVQFKQRAVEASQRIEELDNHCRDLEAKLAQAVEALSNIAVTGYSDDHRVAAAIARQAVDQARAALKELTGGKNE